MPHSYGEQVKELIGNGEFVNQNEVHQRALDLLFKQLDVNPRLKLLELKRAEYDVAIEYERAEIERAKAEAAEEDKKYNRTVARNAFELVNETADNNFVLKPFQSGRAALKVRNDFHDKNIDVITRHIEAFYNNTVKKKYTNGEIDAEILRLFP